MAAGVALGSVTRCSILSNHVLTVYLDGPGPSEYAHVTRCDTGQDVTVPNSLTRPSCRSCHPVKVVLFPERT